jgi:hypothetical protein
LRGANRADRRDLNFGLSIPKHPPICRLNIGFLPKFERFFDSTRSAHFPLCSQPDEAKELNILSVTFIGHLEEPSKKSIHNITPRKCAYIQVVPQHIVVPVFWVSFKKSCIIKYF